MTRDKMVKVVFVTDGAAWHGMTAERLWALPVGISLYQPENSPLYATAVSYEDVVVARPGSTGDLQFESVHSRGGHSTYQFILEEGVTKADMAPYWKPIERLGCTSESSLEPEDVFAVDVPPNTDVYAVYSLLEAGEQAGIWKFGEGHCGHSLRKD